MAFLIPILDILKAKEADAPWQKHQIGALVISPTRELALQIKEVLDQLLSSITVSNNVIQSEAKCCPTSDFQNLKPILFVGGNSVDDDVHNFKEHGGNVVICTPGRLEDLLTRRQDINLPNAVKKLVSKCNYGKTML